MKIEGVEIRPLKSLEELQAVEALQRMVWDEPTITIHQNMLISFARNGGSVIGALKDDQLIGFVISYLGIANPEADRPAMANLKLVSQRMGVHPEYRDSGIGYALKLAQRRYAIEQGIRLVTWTFDPLKSRNAHLNVRKLGAIVREYYRDYYGTGPSPLVSLNSSDRFLVEWWVTNNRVEQRLRGNRSPLSIAQYVNANATILNPTTVGAAALVQPSDVFSQPQSSVILVEIPPDYDAIVTRDPGLAQAWRQHSREVFESVLYTGYTVTDFIYGDHEGRLRSFYALSHIEYSEFQPGTFSSN